MPTYEYRCPKGHRFDVFQKMSDPPEAKCPTCGKPAERLIVPGAGFLFKGEGFYITDYRSDEYKKAKAAGETSPTAASAGTSEPPPTPAPAAEPKTEPKRKAPETGGGKKRKRGSGKE